MATVRLPAAVQKSPRLTTPSTPPTVASKAPASAPAETAPAGKKGWVKTAVERAAAPKGDAALARVDFSKVAFAEIARDGSYAIGRLGEEAVAFYPQATTKDFKQVEFKLIANAGSGAVLGKAQMSKEQLQQSVLPLVRDGLKAAQAAQSGDVNADAAIGAFKLAAQLKLQASMRDGRGIFSPPWRGWTASLSDQQLADFDALKGKLGSLRDRDGEGFRPSQSSYEGLGATLGPLAQDVDFERALRQSKSVPQLSEGAFMDVAKDFSKANAKEVAKNGLALSLKHVPPGLNQAIKEFVATTDRTQFNAALTKLEKTLQLAALPDASARPEIAGTPEMERTSRYNSGLQTAMSYALLSYALKGQDYANQASVWYSAYSNGPSLAPPMSGNDVQALFAPNSGG